MRCGSRSELGRLGLERDTLECQLILLTEAATYLVDAGAELGHGRLEELLLGSVKLTDGEDLLDTGRLGCQLDASSKHRLTPSSMRAEK